MADYIGATPQNPLLGLLYGGYDWMRSPQRTQQMQGLAGLLEATGIPKTIERMSYGEPLTNIGQANVPLLKPETAEAMMTVAPMVGPTARGAGRLVGSQINRAMMGEGGLLAPITPQPMRIVPPNVVRQMDMPVNLPTSQEFLNAVTQEPSAAITPEGLLMNVKRQQTPKQSGLESVRSGVFYLPEGQAANLKHYKGKTAYGGTEPIEGQTLYKNPLFIKGATGGKAPENAYDSLLGKGAYEQMRADALRVRHPDLIKDPRYNLSDALTPEQFLSKYAPDLEGMGDYIFSNSRQGNQLAYALQEAAVAQKVRDAGHDAVIGYSKGRGDKGEFFSEVFDVREKAYPTPQGDYELMPQFEGLIKQREQPSFQYPQEQALKLAQERAALPVEQGGLGLPLNNTPEMRAKAMGFEAEAYHGTNANVPVFDLSKNITAKDIYSSPNPSEASAYATSEGGNVMPLLLRGKVKDLTKESQYVDNQLRKAYNAQVSKYERQYYPFEQFKESFMRGQLYQDTGGQSAQNALVGELIGNKKSILKIPDAVSDFGVGESYVMQNPANIRSRFAAFDPFRKDVATATAMGVALPDLLAAEYNQQPQSAGLLYPLP